MAATTMTSTQFGWNKFASTLIQRERAMELAHNTAEQLHQDSDDSDGSKSTNARASRALKQKHSKQNGTAKNVKWAKIIIISSDEQSTEEPIAFGEPKKAKTRAQRRAIEEIPEPAAPLQKETRRERRSEYWVMRDDKRRSSARAMKTMEPTD